MEKLTYKQAFDKITEAYIKGEIRPYNSNFCFCGTLCDGSSEWRNDDYGGIFSNGVHKDFMFYTGKQYAEMERVLLMAIYRHTDENYEELLFNGMTAALEVLKEIHRDRGEDVDAHSLVFEKREVVL